jgi:hypothetical protein
MKKALRNVCKKNPRAKSIPTVFRYNLMGITRTMNLPANYRATHYMRTLMIISAVMVLATLILRFGKALYLAPLNLSNENVAAAWFSGMLLMLGSLHAADGFFRLRKTNIKAALAWCVIAGMLFALSADEIGSIHERIKDFVKIGPWLSFLPFLIVLLGCCAWSFIQLWITPSERSRVPGLILGFGILVSVEGQEYLEHVVKWPWYLGPLRSAFEEGSELTGFLILIYTMLPNSGGLFSPARQTQAPAFSVIPGLRWFFVIAGVALAWPMAMLTAALDQQTVNGHLSDWMSSSLFFLSAGLILNHWMKSSREPGTFPSAGVFWLVMASMVCVQIDPIGDSHIFPFTRSFEAFGLLLNARMILLAMCCLGAAESLRARGLLFRTSAITLAFAGVLSAVLAASSAGEALRWGYFITTVSGLVTFASLAHALPRAAMEPQIAQRYEYGR